MLCKEYNTYKNRGVSLLIGVVPSPIIILMQFYLTNWVLWVNTGLLRLESSSRWRTHGQTIASIQLFHTCHLCDRLQLCCLPLISTYSLYWEEVSMTETRDGALMSFNQPWILFAPCFLTTHNSYMSISLRNTMKMCFMK